MRVARAGHAPLHMSEVQRLEIRTDQSDFEGRGGPAPRLLAVRVSDLRYTAL